MSSFTQGPPPQGPVACRWSSGAVGLIRLAVFRLWLFIIYFLRSGVARMVIACRTSAILVVLKDKVSLERLFDWRIGLIVLIATILVFPGNVVETLKGRVKGPPPNTVYRLGSGNTRSAAWPAISNLVVVGWIVGVHSGLTDISLIRTSFFEPIITCEAMEQADPDIAGFGVHLISHNANSCRSKCQYSSKPSLSLYSPT